MPEMGLLHEQYLAGGKCYLAGYVMPGLGKGRLHTRECAACEQVEKELFFTWGLINITRGEPPTHPRERPSCLHIHTNVV